MRAGSIAIAVLALALLGGAVWLFGRDEVGTGPGAAPGAAAPAAPAPSPERVERAPEESAAPRADPRAEPEARRAATQGEGALRVVDADTGADLEQVLLLACSVVGPGLGPGHPGFTELVEGPVRASPVAPEELPVGPTWVTALGYGWRLVNLAAEGPLPTVRLAPAGDLAVMLGEYEAGGGDRLRARWRDGRSAEFGPLSGDRALLAKLAPGEVRVELVRRRGVLGEAVLARGDGEVRAGESTVLALRVAAPPEAPAVRVSGQIVAVEPETADLHKLEAIVLTPVDVSSRAEVPRKRLRVGDEVRVDPEGTIATWSEVLTAGTWCVELVRTGFRAELWVPETEAYEAAIPLPPAREARLSFVDEATGDPVVPFFVLAGSGEDEEGTAAWRVPPSSAPVERHGSDVTVRAWGDWLHLYVSREEGGALVRRALDLREGTAQVVRLPAMVHADLELVLDGAPCPASDEWWQSVTARRVDGEGTFLGWMPGHGTASVHASFSDAGRWRIEAPGIVPVEAAVRDGVAIKLVVN